MNRLGTSEAEAEAGIVHNEQVKHFRGGGRNSS